MNCKRIRAIFFAASLFFLSFSLLRAEIQAPAVAIYGDSRTNHAVHKKIIALIHKENPIALFHTGDYVDNGMDKEQWKEFDSLTQEIRATIPFYPCMGNHEAYSPFFFKTFHMANQKPWYSVDIENVHWIVLDSNARVTTHSQQYRWLLHDLKTMSRETRFLVALFHNPIFTLGKHEPDEKGFRASVIPLLERYKVEAIVAGHNHDYERFFYNGVYYIVTGGGGAPLYGKQRDNPYNQQFIKAYHFCKVNIEKRQLQFSIMDQDGAVIDHFAIEEKKINREAL